MNSEARPEVVRPMKLPGEPVLYDPYDNEVPPSEEEIFEQALSKSDAITTWDY